MTNRRTFISSAGMVLAGGVLARAPLLAQAAPAPAARFHDLRRGVGYFTGPGGTIGWLATRDGATAIDSQFPDTAQVCLDGLRQRSSRGIQVLINTHHHGDHTAGNGVFRPAVGQIVQHDGCARMHRSATRGAGEAAQKGLADTTFEETWSATIGSEGISLAYYGPAHTSGDAVVLFENANVVHLGDLVFNRIPPFVDRPAGASIRNWITVLERISAKHRDATFIFGHGKNDTVTGTVKDVRHFSDYLSAVREYVENGISAGRPQQDITSLEVVPGFPEHVNVLKTYASPVPLFSLAHVLTAMYEELTESRAPDQRR